MQTACTPLSPLRTHPLHELVGRHPTTPIGCRPTHPHLRPHPASPGNVDEVNGVEPEVPQKTGRVLDDPVNRVDLTTLLEGGLQNAQLGLRLGLGHSLLGMWLKRRRGDDDPARGSGGHLHQCVWHFIYEINQIGLFYMFRIFFLMEASWEADI